MGRKHTRRVNEAVRQAVADLLEQEISDPRVAHVTVTDARVSDDLRHATIYYTAVEPSTVHTRRGEHAAVPSAAEVAAGLERAAPRVQSLLSGRVRMRNTPALRFVADPVADEGRRIEELLRSVREADPPA